MIIKNIFIKFTEGTKVYNEIDSKITIHEFINKIAELRNINENIRGNIRLSYCGKILEYDKTLEEYKVENESTFLFWYSMSKRKVDISKYA